MDTNAGARLLHITIGTAPSPNEMLAHDLRLVKAALLYADKVMLCSPVSSLVFTILAMTEFTLKQQLDFLESIAPVVLSDSNAVDRLLAGLRQYRQIAHTRHPNTEQYLFKLRFERQFERQWSDFKDVIYRTAEDAGANGIVQAISSGILDIHAFGRSAKSADPFDNIIPEFADVIGSALIDGSTYPLFDDQTGGLVRTGISEGRFHLSEIGVSRSRHVGLAAKIMERLPLFEMATVDEVLTIRSELQKPLIRFRRAMLQFSEKIKTAQWDNDFAAEADLTYYREIEPSILDIEEAIRSNSYLASFIRRTVDKPLALAGGSALAMVMSQLSSFPELASFGLGTTTLATVAYDVHREWRQKQQNIEQNCLYFYYAARQKLAEQH